MASWSRGEGWVGSGSAWASLAVPIPRQPDDAEWLDLVAWLGRTPVPAGPFRLAAHADVTDPERLWDYLRDGVGRGPADDVRSLLRRLREVLGDARVGRDPAGQAADDGVPPAL